MTGCELTRLAQNALRLAREAGTGRLLLTHFSTSMEEPEEHLPAARAVFPRTGCARDGMTMTLRYDGVTEQTTPGWTET